MSLTDREPPRHAGRTEERLGARSGGATVRRRPRRPGGRSGARGRRGGRRARESVLPRGGIQSSPRPTTAMIAIRGRPTSRTAAPAIAWSGATTKSIRSSLVSAPTSIGGSCRGGAGERRSRRPATHSSVVPCRIAETTTTKKTALKIVFACGDLGREHEGREHDRDRSAQPGPAEQQPFTRGEVAERRGDPDRGGPDRGARAASASASPATATSGELAREHEQAEDDEQRDLRDERDALVERDELPPVARRRAADREPDEVHGEESAPADHVGGAERQRGGRDRRDRRERADRVGEAGEPPRRRGAQARRRRAVRGRSAATTSSTRSANP